MAAKPFSSGVVVNAADLNDLAGVYDRATAAIDVVNTLTETDIYSKSIGAGHMSTDRWLRLRIIGDYLNNVGSTGITLRVKFGGTTLFGHNISGIAADPDRMPFHMELYLPNLGSTSSQFLYGTINGFAAAAAGSVAGIVVTESGRTRFSSSGTVAIATASAQTLAVTAQHDSASANISIRRHAAMLELL